MDADEGAVKSPLEAAAEAKEAASSPAASGAGVEVDSADVPSASGAEDEKRTIYELFISNAGKWLKFRDVRKHLENAGVKNIWRVKKEASAMAAYVHFTSKEDLDDAKAKADGLVVKNQTWILKENPSFRQKLSSAPQENATDNAVSGKKRPRSDIADPVLSPEELDTKLADAVIPWHAKPYEEQLREKHVEMQSVLRNIVSKLRMHIIRNMDVPSWFHKKFPKPKQSAENSNVWGESISSEEIKEHTGGAIPDWLLVNPQEHNFQACKLQDIVPSPVIIGYRNKVELAFGKTPTGAVCVGNRLGSFGESVRVWPIDKLTHVPEGIRKVASIVSAFAASSPLPIYDIVDHTGVWRQVTIRQTRFEQQTMVSLIAKPPADAADRDVYASELKRLVQSLTETDVNMKSIYLQEYDGLSAPAPNHPFALLHGSETIVEQLSGKKFLISPGAFFQVNTAAAEELFRIIKELSIHPDASGKLPALLDICCGTGTIGLVCADAFSKLVGVELSESAVADAKKNAEANGNSSASFVASKAEDVMKNLIALASGSGPTAGSDEVVAIVDPPRGGLHPDVVRAIRTARPIKRLVYVSCNPTGSFVEDALKLCAPAEKNSRFAAGPAFRPIVSVPVDMFPNTPHCELVTLFERTG